MTLEFKAWPKLPRLNREIVITEKIDGTNAAVIIGENGEFAAQSRNRLITPDDDNYGFAAWVWSNVGKLQAALGPGHHYGEWWGSKVGRGYGFKNGERFFSLFNTSRWDDLVGADHGIPELTVVPTLYAGMFSALHVTSALSRLQYTGSAAAPGFDRPEGVVVFHTAANQMFKVTLENDELPKALAG